MSRKQCLPQTPRNPLNTERWIHDESKQIRLQGYKSSFMLNSTERAICPANKSQIIDNYKL